MTALNFGKAGKHAIAYLVILFIVILTIRFISKGKAKEVKHGGYPDRKAADGNGSAYYHARGHESDSVSQLLDRIDWSAYLEKRTNPLYKEIIVTFIIMALVLLLYEKKLPSPPRLIILFFAIFIPIHATHKMFYTHGGIYNDYYIKNNVHLIRTKLQLEKNEPTEPHPDVPHRKLVMAPR